VKPKILVLGAGFAGVEYLRSCPNRFSDAVEVTLIDKSNRFMCGFSQLDVMLGCKTAQAQRLYDKNFAKPVCGSCSDHHSIRSKARGDRWRHV